MKRWNIRTIALFSHDGRRRDIALKLGAVNIITGPSHSGKSAVAEIIDYCMGSKDCHLPGLVREAASWVGLLWERGNQRFAVARRVPGPGEGTVNQMFWQKGALGNDALMPGTASELYDVGSRDSVMRLIEEAFGIGEVVGETLNPDRAGRRISARHVVPYMLQDDDVIISKNTLLRGAQDERRRDLIDTLPYFLRVTDESMAALEAEYRRLSKQIRNQERRTEELQKIVSVEQQRADMLLAEAAQVGIVDVPRQRDLAESIALLEKARDWRPGTMPETTNNQLAGLYAEESSLRSSVAELRSNIRASEQLLQAAAGFNDVARDQSRKLAHITLFKKHNDTSVCPVCNNDVAGVVPTVSAVVSAHTALSAELRDVERDRPKIDAFLSRKKEELDSKLEQLRETRERIASLVNEADSESMQIDLEHRRSRVVGRISLFLDSRSQLSQAESPNLDEIRMRLAELEGLIDIESKRDRLAVEQQAIGGIATRIVGDLPFEEEYRTASVYFLARTLECGVATAERRIPMRDVGSDENYLSLHVALLIAFHRFFGQRRAPVPGVLLFDQLSRPYYPPEDRPDEVVVEDETEAGALKRYFDFLFRETQHQSDLQVIVLEHAYLKSDKRFVDSVVERWSRTGKKLIPADWPRIGPRGVDD